MKRFCTLLLVITMILTMTACSQQSAKVTQTPASTPTQSQEQSTPTITPEPEPFAPKDIFGSEFNPFFDVEFPDSFNIYGALFDIGDPKFDGKAKYVLSMTAEGKTNEAITFLAKLAGIKDADGANKYVDEFNKGGFCEFQSADGSLFTIRKTNQNDDRYQYVEGCHADIQVNLNEDVSSKYILLVGDNYNVNALNVAANYFDVKPIFEECGIYVNLHKKSIEINMRYAVKDVAAIQQNMQKNIKSTWYDANNGKMGLSYGMIDMEILFDSRRSQISVTEKTSEMQNALADYTASDVSLSSLGFNYAEKDALCTYEDKRKNISIAIYKPEWGNRNDGWNIEYLHEVNGYNLAMWYNAQKQEFRIQADKGSSSAVYYYFIKTNKYGEEWPDPDTVKKQFKAAFGTQDGDVYQRAMSLFEQTIQERFGMSWEKLYALPIR